MKLASKSKNRIELVDIISEGISTKDVFGTINYKKQSEDKIKQFIYPHLVESLGNFISEKKDMDKSLAREKAKSLLKWEGNVNTTVHNMIFMGTSNRPDMSIEYSGVKIAIEIKRGDRGADLRAGFGQSLVYSTVYDFIIYMFIDCSEDGRIKNAKTGISEEKFLENLWDNFNIKFIVV
jgi:hypothetical protein